MISFWGLAFTVLFAGFFVWLFGSAYFFGLGERSQNLRPDRKSVLAFCTYVFAGAWLCYWLLCQNRYIYYWDLSGYWRNCISQMNLLFSSPVFAVLKLGSSIWFSEYNSILPTLTALPLKVAGYTFTRYVLVNYFCFLVPTWFILASVMKLSVAKRYYMAIVFFVLITFNPFYTAMLRGYIDVACLVPASIAVLLLKDYDAASLSANQIRRDIYIALMLLCTLMFRRYFAFYAEGYAAALMCLSVYSVIADSRVRNKTKLLRNAIINIAIVGIVSLAAMAILFGPMLVRVLKNNYSDMYSAYNLPIKNKIFRVVTVFGYFTFILAGAGLILSLITKTMRRYTCFCAVSFIVTSLTFFHVQSMGIHHIYTLSIQMFIMSCTGIIQIIELAKKKNLKRFIALLCLLITAAGSANCYLPSLRPMFKPVSFMFSPVYNPLRRNDIPVLNELADYLNAYGQDHEVHVIASGSILNLDILNTLKLPYEFNYVRNATEAGSVDLRDGFPAVFLSSDVIVITDPVQLHLKEGSQEIVRFLVQEIKDSSSPLGRHFKRDERTFTLDGGVNVYIYNKQSEFEHEDLQYVADYFTKLYPGREDMFADIILGRIKDSDSPRHKMNPLKLEVVKWILQKRIFTPEELSSLMSSLNLDELKALLEEK